MPSRSPSLEHGCGSGLPPISSSSFSTVPFARRQQRWVAQRTEATVGGGWLRTVTVTVRMRRIRPAMGEQSRAWDLPLSLCSDPHCYKRDTVTCYKRDTVARATYSSEGHFLLVADHFLTRHWSGLQAPSRYDPPIFSVADLNDVIKTIYYWYSSQNQWRLKITSPNTATGVDVSSDGFDMTSSVIRFLVVV